MSTPLVEIVVTRNEGKINYKINCSNEVTSEELAHYLDEIIEGVCAWKPAVCEETFQTMVGTIEESAGKKEK